MTVIDDSAGVARGGVRGRPRGRVRAVVLLAIAFVYLVGVVLRYVRGLAEAGSHAELISGLHDPKDLSLPFLVPVDMAAYVYVLLCGWLGSLILMGSSAVPLLDTERAARGRWWYLLVAGVAANACVVAASVSPWGWDILTWFGD